MSAQKIQAKTETAYFGGGCFWGIEEYFKNTKGVVRTAVGYMGGKTSNPTYEEVCSDLTEHIEVVEVEYDPKIISYLDLLDKFWLIHDPTTEDHQGPDYGSQYKSVIFYTTIEQKKLAEESKEKLDNSRKFQAKIVTEIKKAPTFWKAEEYHQQYLAKRNKTICH